MFLSLESFYVFVVTILYVQIDDDLDFTGSNYDVYNDGNILFERNTTEGIKMGMNNVIKDEEAPESNSSSYAFSEELNFLSGSDSEENNDKSRFHEYCVEKEKRNLRLAIRLFYYERLCSLQSG